jgi:hypothetical protein
MNIIVDSLFHIMIMIKQLYRQVDLCGIGPLGC